MGLFLKVHRLHLQECLSGYSLSLWLAYDLHTNPNLACKLTRMYVRTYALSESGNSQSASCLLAGKKNIRIVEGKEEKLPELRDFWSKADGQGFVMKLNLLIQRE